MLASVQLRTLPIDELLGRLEDHATRDPGGAVAFDGDGTLWSGDVGEDFFSSMIAQGQVGPAAYEALAREARAAGLDATGSPLAIASRIHSAYLADRFPEERVCEIMTWVYAGMTRADLDAAAARIVVASGVEARLHGEALRVLAWARERGIPALLVSASPRAIVEAAARLVGIEPPRIAAVTELRTSEGVVLPDVERPIPYGQGKVTGLRRILGEKPLYAAFGDNAFDVPMLCEARIPVAIRPKARLLDRAGDVPDLAVLERL